MVLLSSPYVSVRVSPNEGVTFADIKCSFKLSGTELFVHAENGSIDYCIQIGKTKRITNGFISTPLIEIAIRYVLGRCRRPKDWLSCAGLIQTEG